MAEPDRKQIAADRASRSFSCDFWTDPLGQRWEDFRHATDEEGVGGVRPLVSGWRSATQPKANGDAEPSLVFVRISRDAAYCWSFS